MKFGPKHKRRSDASNSRMKKEKKKKEKKKRKRKKRTKISTVIALDRLIRGIIRGLLVILSIQKMEEKCSQASWKWERPLRKLLWRAITREQGTHGLFVPRGFKMQQPMTSSPEIDAQPWRHAWRGR